MPPNEIKTVLLEVAGLLGYLGFAIALWQITTSIFLLIIYFQCLVCLVFILRYYLVQQRMVELKESLNEAIRRAEALQRIRDLLEGMLSLWLYATERPHFDTKHHFTFIRDEYIIHGDDGTYNWVLKGFNTLDKPSSFLTMKISGDAPIDASSLALSVIDNVTGQRYQTRLVEDMPHLKIFEIIFPKPLAKGQYFDLKLSCRWDNTFPRSRKHDYVFFPLGLYANKGIDMMVVRVVVDVPIRHFVLYRLDAGELIKEPAQPRIVNKVPGHFTLEWETWNPYCVYILRFTKKEGNVPMPSDEKRYSTRSRRGSPVGIA